MWHCTDGQFRACTECGRSEFDDKYLSTKLSISSHSLDVLRQAKQLKTDGGRLSLLFFIADPVILCSLFFSSKLSVFEYLGSF